VQSAEIIAEIETPAGDESRASLDGYDALALRAELNWLQQIEHPWGPFATYERHLEYILSQYDIVLPERHIIHASCTQARKESLI